jgi:hypothetical protein
MPKYRTVAGRRSPRRWPRQSPDEAGMAMIIAVLVILLLTLIPLTMFFEAVQQLPLARHDQDHESALHAAEAGVEDYINHLNANNNYWSLGNAPGDGNQAFTTWVPVPGPSTTESFRYSVDATTTLSKGVIYVTSSGRSCAGTSSTCANGVVRTVKVGLRKSGFLDYLYLTDYELQDPALSGDPASCLLHAWQKNTSTGGYGPDTSQCSLIYMTNSAVFNGPVHTNDAFYVCGNPTFNGPVTATYNNPVNTSVAGVTSFAGTGPYLNPSNCGNSPNFSRNVRAVAPFCPISGSPTTANCDPVGETNFGLPNAQLPTVKTAAANAGTAGGCLFTGPTTIALHYTANVGTMDVTSKGSKSLNTSSCMTASQLTTLKSGSTVPNLALPPNGVIYVENTPSNTTDPNYSSCSGTACNGDVNVANSAINGGLAGQLTIASDNNIVVTGNLTYHQYPGGSDVLGLIASQNVAIYHPIDDRGNNATGTNTNVTVDAAILSLTHSFYVQNWSQGALLGTLTVNGSISQEFRGPVGTFSGQSASTGYAKAYTYDSRLTYLTPPYFLTPVASAWRKLSFAEIKPAF